MVFHSPATAHPGRELGCANFRAYPNSVLFFTSFCIWQGHAQSIVSIADSSPSIQLLLGIITIIPWATLLIFDIGLYLYRMLLWEFPWIGGRARGHQRPPAPSLNERPDGQLRTFGLRSVDTDTEQREETKSRSASVDLNDDAEKENVAPIATDERAHTSDAGQLKQRAPGRT